MFSISEHSEKTCFYYVERRKQLSLLELCHSEQMTNFSELAIIIFWNVMIYMLVS